MKIFLGNIPWYKDGFYGVRAGSRWPHFQKLPQGEKIPHYIPFPFFLSYAAAVLEKDGFEVLLVDGIAEGLNTEQFLIRIKDFSPDVILFETSTPTINYDIQFVSGLRKKYKGNYKVALSGPHAEMHTGRFLEEHKEVDFILVGEYEITVKELCKTIENKKSLKKVLGLIYRDKAGRVSVNEPRPLIKDIDLLPYPARHFLPMHRYSDLVCGLPGPSLQMWASRGCPYGCIFCFWPQVMYHGSNYRVRNPKMVVDELEETLKRYKFKSFYFDDDTFNIGKARIMELCREIKRRNLNLPWAIMARADTMDVELLKALKKAGLYAVKYGMESVVQELVDNSGKNLDLNKAQEIVRQTQKMGIKVHLTFSFGLPGETKETINQTINKIIELNPDSAQFSIITPFPGSKYYEALKEKKLIFSYNWDDYNGSMQSVFRTESLSEKDLDDALSKAKDRWNKRYHLQPECIKEFFNKVGAGLLKSSCKKEDVKRILVFRSSFLEHTQHALSVFKEKFPKATIDLLVQKNAANQFKNNGINVIEYPDHNFSADKKSISRLQKLAQSSYDLGIVLYNNTERYGYAAVERLARESKAKALFGVYVEGKVERIGKRSSRRKTAPFSR